MKELLKKLKELEYNNLYPFFFTLIFIFILIQYSFTSLDAIFYDLWIKADPFTEKKEDIIVIAVDEESDQFLGEIYPYTYATHVRFVRKILEDEPLQVGYLVPFQEPQSPLAIEDAKEFKKIIQKFREDDGNFLFGADKDAWGIQLPPENLLDLGYSLAIINRDGEVFARDDVTRRAILNASGEDTLHLKMANIYRKNGGASAIETSQVHGAYYDREADAIFSLFKYQVDPLSKERYESIPFHRVVVGNYPRGFFKGKTVLVGPKYISNSDDFIKTPYAKDEDKAPKLNIHAQIIAALVQNDMVYEVPASATDFIAVLLAIGLSLLISRLQPTRGLVTTVMIMLTVFTVGYLLFVFAGVWVKLSHIILSIFVVYYIWVPFRAIGEYQTRYAIQEETKILKRVDRLKQNFISLMSHDLKTPVAKIAGIADILKVQYSNSEKQNELLDNIIHSTKELNDFITSILDLTKVESRNISLKLESKDVNPIIEQTFSKLVFEAKANSIVLETDLGPLYPIQLDSTLINRVIGNLVGNAIKYAGKGSKVLARTWDDENWVYIEISDNGRGISKEDLDNIFDKFYRVKNDQSHQIKGSGLGLYLVKYFIELHQGSISVKSEVGSGTSFTVKLKNA